MKKVLNNKFIIAKLSPSVFKSKKNNKLVSWRKAN